MSKLDQRGVVHLLVPLILLAGLIGGVYLITAGPLKLFSKASVSGPIGGVTYVETKIGCGNPQGLTPDQICQQKGFPRAAAVDGDYAAKGYWWRQCGGASVSNCTGLNCTVNQLDCTNTPGYWGSQQPYPENFTKVGTPTKIYQPAGFDVPNCADYAPGWTMRVACSLVTQPPPSAPPPVSGPIPPPTSAPSPSPSPISGYRVFVTSTAYNGNLGGLAGADAKCQERANATNLGGTWKAWLSDSTTSAASRLEHASVPYKLINGTVIANNWADLTDGTLINQINVDQFGSRVLDRSVWTGTTANGSVDPLGRNCKNWTFAGAPGGDNPVARHGYNFYIDSQWTDYAVTACVDNDPFFTKSLYCFEQAPSPSPTPVACTINDLRAAFFARRGDAKYNQACDFNNDGRISVTDYSALLRNLRR